MRTVAWAVAFAFLSTAAAGAAECVRLTEGQSARVGSVPELPLVGAYSLVRLRDLVLTEDETTSSGLDLEEGDRVANYEVLVNIDFLAEANASADAVARARSSARSCLASISHKLRGPKGERLRILLSQDRPNQPAPAAVQVRVHRSFQRPNSGNWEEGMNCPTVVHETLHLLGLVDEYRENGGADPARQRFDCRSVGPRSSIMAAQVFAYQRVNADDLSQFFNMQGHPSLLSAAQFGAIVFPGCSEINATYYACARDAYRTSREHGGEGCRGGRPTICETRNWIHKIGAY
jgi:hypothetical protein